MLKKRIIATIIVKDDWAVQSFSYKSWLPLGKPECLAENYDRWGADEIVLIVVDRFDNGPDLELIKKISSLGLTTPLTYSGGIRNKKDAVSVINAGAERIALDNLLVENPSEIEEISRAIGIQAILASFPMIQESNGNILHYIHKTRITKEFGEDILKLIKDEKISELIIIDKEGEGSENGFNQEFIEKIKNFTNLPLLVFGGIVKEKQIAKLLSIPEVSGVLVGNSLNYKEHSINRLKKNLSSQQIRLHNLEGL